jgi:hypothetical protein
MPGCLPFFTGAPVPAPDLTAKFCFQLNFRSTKHEAKGAPCFNLAVAAWAKMDIERAN